MMVVYVSVAVALVCFILYALDRKSKSEPIDWATALKLSLFGGILSGGVSFATTSGEVIPELVKQIPPEIPPVQDMFVGVPTF